MFDSKTDNRYRAVRVRDRVSVSVRVKKSLKMYVFVDEPEQCNASNN